MSLIDDLKTELEKTSIPEHEIEPILVKITKLHGGTYPYIRLNVRPNCRKKNRI